jgi:hypothetical protein
MSAELTCLCRCLPATLPHHSLIEQQLVSPVAAVAWLASPERLTLGPADDEGAAADAWALLHASVTDAFARYQGALESRERLVAAVTKAEGVVAAASAESSAAAAIAAEQSAAAAGGDAAGGAGGGRHRVPDVLPGSGRAPPSRVQLARLREEAAFTRLTRAQQAVADHDAAMARLERERRDTLQEVCLWSFVERGWLVCRMSTQPAPQVWRSLACSQRWGTRCCVLCAGVHCAGGAPA